MPKSCVSYFRTVCACSQTLKYSNSNNRCLSFTLSLALSVLSHSSASHPLPVPHHSIGYEYKNLIIYLPKANTITIYNERADTAIAPQMHTHTQSTYRDASGCSQITPQAMGNGQFSNCSQRGYTFASH